MNVSFRVPWWVHLIGWIVVAVPVALLTRWWIAPLAIVAFELLLTAVRLRRRVPVIPSGWDGPGPDNGGGAGVREPRRPLPTAGSGAADLPT